MGSFRSWGGLTAVAAVAVAAASAPITCVGAEPIAASSSAAATFGLFESAKAALECHVCKVRA